MLIVCPSCASEYMIDPARLGPEGRTVRCASCRATWFVARAAAEEFVTPAPEDSEETAAGGWAEEAEDHAHADGLDEAPAFPPREEEQSAAEDDAEKFLKTLRKERAGRRSGDRGLSERARGFASGVLILLILVVPAAAVFGRVHMVKLFPGMATLYARAGLPVNLRGIEFREVRSELVTAGADAFLVVEGEVANISGREAAVPPIEIAVRGAEGQTLYTWTNDPPRGTLGVGQTPQFRARLAAPPPEGRQVLVHFAAGQDGAALASHIR